MKILLVSMNSIHFQRWTNQLKDSGHDVYWFNIRDGGYSEKLPWVNQITGWKQKFPNLKGRSFVKKRWPKLYEKFSFLIENNTEKAFEKKLDEIKPDVVHSFVLYVSCVPIFKIMQKHLDVKWIYSSWGSDLFYYQNEPEFLNNIKKVLPRVNYLFTDCKRDVVLAKKYGFKGTVLGVFPGGGGYPLEAFKPYVLPVNQRHTILVKGYQGRSGRAIQVLKALEALTKDIINYKIIVFAADKDVEHFITESALVEKLDVTIYRKSQFMPHIEIIKLMGQALIYIGNSNSDGMPNTLLEAIIMGAFPIQSNPGGASEDVIVDGENGLLINDFNDSEEIKQHIQSALNHSELIDSAFHINQEQIKIKYEASFIKTQVLEAYSKILNLN